MGMLVWAGGPAAPSVARTLGHFRVASLAASREPLPHSLPALGTLEAEGRPGEPSGRLGEVAAGAAR